MVGTLHPSQFISIIGELIAKVLPAKTVVPRMMAKIIVGVKSGEKMMRLMSLQIGKIIIQIMAV